MPEDFTKVFTVEIFTSKEVWEVVKTANTAWQAIDFYKKELAAEPILPVRLTSPTDVSIYEQV